MIVGCVAAITKYKIVLRVALKQGLSFKKNG